MHARTDPYGGSRHWQWLPKQSAFLDVGYLDLISREYDPSIFSSKIDDFEFSSRSVAETTLISPKETVNESALIMIIGIRS